MVVKKDGNMHFYVKYPIFFFLLLTGGGAPVVTTRKSIHVVFVFINACLALLIVPRSKIVRFEID